MKKSPLLWVIGGVALIYILGRKALAKNFRVDLNDVSAGGGLLRPYFILKFSVFNPTNQKAVIRSIVGEVDFNNEALANVNSFQAQIIEPNAESIVMVKVTPSILSSISQIYKLITTKTKTANLKFVGTFNIDNVLIPVENNLSV
jgi:LEA14-like dessication related protein